MYETVIIVLKCYGYVTTIYTLYHVYSYTQILASKTYDVSKFVYSYVINENVDESLEYKNKNKNMEEEVWVKLNFIEE